MLNVQEYLKSGKTLDDLNAELGINSSVHPELPLTILNYDQIDSPKTHPIVRECRGLVLNKEDWSLVARSFPRFFNWGEVADELALFNWNNVSAQEKVDGSLCIFYHFGGEWRVNTRGSFGLFPILDNDYKKRYFKIDDDKFTWQVAILRALGLNSLKELDGLLDPKVTYVCEFCSLWNKVVREYPQPKVYLLTRFVGEEEIGAVDHPLFHRVGEYKLASAEAVADFVNNHPEATFEGCVVKDDAHRRWKIKSLRYLALHRMGGGNGDALWNPVNLIPFILDGEEGELGATLKANHPEVMELFWETKEKVDKAFAGLQDVWTKNWQIDVQKDFALAIVGKTPFTSILFDIRKKHGKDQSLAILKKAWREWGDGIVKVLFKK